MKKMVDVVAEEVFIRVVAWTAGVWLYSASHHRVADVPVEAAVLSSVSALHAVYQPFSLWPNSRGTRQEMASESPR